MGSEMCIRDSCVMNYRSCSDRQIQLCAMLGNSHRGQGEEMIQVFFVDRLIPENHIFRALDAALDTRWVRDQVASCSSARWGRRWWDGEVIVRMMLLGYL